MNIGTVDPSSGDGGLGEYEATIMRLRQEMAALQREAENARQAVRRAQQSTESAIQEVNREGARQASHMAEHAGHSGAMHALHQVHAVERLGRLGTGQVGTGMSSARGLFRSVGALGGEGVASAIAPALGPAMLGAFVGHEIMEQLKERYEQQKQSAEAQVEMYKVAAEAQLSEDARGTGQDVYALRREAYERGRQQAYLARRFFSLADNDEEQRLAGAKAGKAAVERARKAQKLYGGTMEQALKQAGSLVTDQMVEGAFKVENNAFARSFMLKDQQEARKMEIREELEDKQLQGEILRREANQRETELQEPSQRALNKQFHEYFHVIEEENHTKRQQWAMT